MGAIGHGIDPPADTWPDSPLCITPPTPSFISNEIEREAINGMLSPVLGSPSVPYFSDLDFPSTLAHNNHGTVQFWIEDQLSGATLDHNHYFYDEEASRPLDLEGYPLLLPVGSQAAPAVAGEADARVYRSPWLPPPTDGAGNEEMTQPPMGSPPTGTINTGSEHPNEWWPTTIQDERHNEWHTQQKRSECQVNIIQFEPAKKWPVTTLVLDNPSWSPHGGTGRVHL